VELPFGEVRKSAPTAARIMGYGLGYNPFESGVWKNPALEMGRCHSRI
jgi:hypothetical protein